MYLWLISLFTKFGTHIQQDYTFYSNMNKCNFFIVHCVWMQLEDVEYQNIVVYCGLIVKVLNAQPKGGGFKSWPGHDVLLTTDISPTICSAQSVGLRV